MAKAKKVVKGKTPITSKAPASAETSVFERISKALKMRVGKLTPTEWITMACEGLNRLPTEEFDELGDDVSVWYDAAAAFINDDNLDMLELPDGAPAFAKNGGDDEKPKKKGGKAVKEAKHERKERSRKADGILSVVAGIIRKKPSISKEDLIERVTEAGHDVAASGYAKLVCDVAVVIAGAALEK